MIKFKQGSPEGEVSGAAADLSSAEGVRERFTGAHPEVDILVNNVSMFDPKPFGEISDDEWLDFFKLNVMSGVRLSRHYLPQMKEQGWGRIVFISSESAIHIPAGDDSLRHDENGGDRGGERSGGNDGGRRASPSTRSCPARRARKASKSLSAGWRRVRA